MRWPKEARSSPSFWAELWRTLRLAWRLLGDRRVSPFLKVLVPGLAVVYLLFPIDVVPDGLPGLGQLDDLAILILAARLLVEMSPPSVVAQYESELRGKTGSQTDMTSPEDVMDAEYRVIE
ncbi:MAG: DUF1232 domain-containing protein [Anaerolineae bacterium]|nr:DUF1232 domain-containing protein [Anaerolineae bacterium]